MPPHEAAPGRQHRPHARTLKNPLFAQYIFIIDSRVPEYLIIFPIVRIQFYYLYLKKKEEAIFVYIQSIIEILRFGSSHRLVDTNL